MDASSRVSPLRQRMIDDGTVKLTAKVRKCPGRMGNISRLRVLSSFGTLVQREVRRSPGIKVGDIGMHVR